MKAKLFDAMPRLGDDAVLLRMLEPADAEGLARLIADDKAYRWLPTFLAEKQAADAMQAIADINGRCFREKESLILGIFLRESGDFCGLAEFYGYKDALHKVCTGYRLREPFWGRGIATRAVGLMVDYLYGQTDIELITASTMVENRASARVLEKNGYLMTARAVPEDWGYPEPTIADKWFR